MEAAAGGDAEGGVRGVELRRQMAAQRTAFERQIAVARERAASASAAYRAALFSARSHSHQTLSHQEELTGLKGRFRELEAQLAQALSVKVRKESKCELTKESISSTSAINEQLTELVTGQRNKRNQYAAVVSNQLEAVEALEAKSIGDETWMKNIEEAVTWYDKFLGFHVIGGEGVKFVFNKVDLQSPDKEYSFSIMPDKDRHNLLRCDPHMKDSEELMKDLNPTNDLFKFVRIIRHRLQAATVNGILPGSSVVCPDATSIAVSSPVVMSVDTRSENVADQSHYQSKNKKQALPTKRRAAALSAASPGTVVSSVRRSPRFVVTVSSPLDTFPVDDYLGEKQGGIDAKSINLDCYLPTADVLASWGDHLSCTYFFCAICFVSHLVLWQQTIYFYSALDQFLFIGHH